MIFLFIIEVCTLKKLVIDEERVKDSAIFHALIDSSFNGYELFDHNMNYVAVNKVILDRLGLSRVEIIGKHIRDTGQIPPMINSNDYLRL